MKWYYAFPTKWIWPNLGASELDVLELGWRAAGYMHDESIDSGLPWGVLMDIQYFMTEGKCSYTEACEYIRNNTVPPNFDQ